VECRQDIARHKKRKTSNHYFFAKTTPKMVEYQIYLAIVSGFSIGKIQKEKLYLNYYIQKSFLSPKNNFLLVQSFAKKFYIYDIVNFEANDNPCCFKLKENEEITLKVNNSVNVLFMSFQNKEKLIFLSEKNQLHKMDLESTASEKILIENEVLDFGCINKSEIIVIQKDLKIKVFDLEKNKFKENMMSITTTRLKILYPVSCTIRSINKVTFL
jgi:hypothetical protein